MSLEFTEKVNLMKRYISFYSFFLLVLFLFNTTFAADPLKPFKTETPPKIDGILDDKVWQNAPFVTGFKTWMPDYGIDMVEKTKAFFAYDRENLYFSFKCYDSQPDKIKTSITSRDNVRTDDWVCINLDSFNDQQSLYAFYINPAGIQGDSRYAGGAEDHDFDAVWYSAGLIDEEGYNIEVQIPFKSIRFANKNPVEMAVIFERRISRRSEQGTYPALSPEGGMAAFLNDMQALYYYDVKQYKLFELLPAVTYGKKQSHQKGKLTSEDSESDISLTTKYGITSHLILDGTYNPDFSQVESDAGQVDVNLRYALFFPEKRPFFLEGRENFNFAGSSHHASLRSIVHTRNIVNPLTGIKLSGKIGDKTTIASLYAIDELPEGSNENYAHFSIFRYKRALNQDSYLGGFYTGRERENGYNRVLGSDGILRVSQSSLFNYYLFGSQTDLSPESESKDGHSVGLKYKYNTRSLNLDFGLSDLSKDFNTEVGYLTRNGISNLSAVVSPKLFPKINFIRRIDLTFYSNHTNDKFFDTWEYFNYGSIGFLLWRNSKVTLSYNKSNEYFLIKKYDTSKIQLSGSSQFTKQLYFSISYNYGKKIRYISDPYQGKGNKFSISIRYQPILKFLSSLSMTYSDFFRSTDSEIIYDYTIIRSRNTYQLNKYLFFRGIVEYNSFRKEMLTDFLVSFTYIPGTVIHFGYGSLYEKIRWRQDQYIESDQFLETKRGFFFKTSYLWRM